MGDDVTVADNVLVNGDVAVADIGATDVDSITI